MSKNQAVLLKVDDWEMLYINGELQDEGHTLNGGASRIKYFVGLAKKYNFDLSEFYEIWVNEEDDAELEEYGSGHRFLSEYKGNYAPTPNQS